MDRITEAERRKRLGQYFSGLGLGRLLAALAQAEKARSIIDPMVGSGDLLEACLGIDAEPELIAGIEIDGKAHDLCSHRLPQAVCLHGSAFDPDVISRLPLKSWDLVIANPPYVRYQSLSDKADASHALPSAMQIRTGLLQALQLLPALDSEDKRLFAHMVSGYSGLSDLAVPSWILCAGLVKQGGRIALVVPESWLSRDYAAIVHYLLFRWFDIEFVVEDKHASWFEDAQIKTTLVVAKRVKRRSSALSTPKGASYCHISISAAAASSDSPIGRLALSGRIYEKSFARNARSWLRNASRHTTGLARAHPVSLKLACSNVIALASRQKWFAMMGEKAIAKADSVYIPPAINEWLARVGVTQTFETFEAQGIAVGQGLRTGANSFFYADGEREGDQVRLAFGGSLAGLSAAVPTWIVKPVLRRQSELPKGFVVSPANISGWALDLRRHALPEDLGASDLIPKPYHELPSELARVVRTAAKANFGTEAKPQKVWELTAVATNIRVAAIGTPARRWYMLPNFAPRHLPDVLLPRVNSATPKAYLNDERRCLIDANFSAMWARFESSWSAKALLAFMNSAWAQALIECSGAVMGGGALKVEATHLRRLPVLPFTNEQLVRLGQLGDRLASSEDRAAEVLGQIDAIAMEALGCDEEAALGLRMIARAGRTQRAKHNGKRGEKYGDEVC